MKDYTLSEVKAHCKARVGKYPFPCRGCEMEVICKSTLPVGWDIEPRDMLDLPCKQEIEFSKEHSEWQVVWRDDFIQRIRFADFPTESEADAFLADLKDLLNGRKQ